MKVSFIGDSLMAKQKISFIIIAFLLVASTGANLGISMGMEAEESIQQDITTPIDEGLPDVPTWIIGTSWTYEQETWYNSTEGNVHWVRLEENVTHTVSAIEYVDIEGVMTPIYRVTKTGEVLEGNGQVQAPLGTAPFEIEEGYYEGYILYRMDDLGVLEEYQYRDMTGTVELFVNNFELTMSRTIVHEPNVEDYDFPLTTERHFWANNTVNTMGFNHVIAGWSVNNNETIDEITHLNRTVHVSEDIVPITVGSNTFDTFEVIENMTGDDEGTKVRYYNDNIQNYVKENANYLDTDWYRVLGSYYIPDNPNSLSVEPSYSFIGETVSISGSFPEHPLEEFNISIPMAGISQQVEADDSGNFTLDIETPDAEDNTPSPGVLSSLGIVAMFPGSSESYQAVTLTILPEPDHIIIEPAEKIVIGGDSVTYSAIAYDAQGIPLMDVTEDTFWSIDEGAGGEWDQETYTAENPGDWTVTGTFINGNNTLVDTAELTVTSPGYIEIEPQTKELIGGEMVEYTAKVFDGEGTEIGDVTEDTVWSIDPGAGGSWDNNVYTSENQGVWTVVGNYTYDGVSYLDDAEITVVEFGFYAIEPVVMDIMSGESVSYSAKIYDSSHEEIKDVTDETNWSIEPDAGGSWDNNVYTSEKTGEWTVTGTYYLGDEEITGTATLMVDLLWDLPTWRIGSYWTYYQMGQASITIEGPEGTIEVEIEELEERLTFTVSSIEYVEIEGVMTPVYNVTIDGDILGGSGEVDAPRFDAEFSIHDGFTEGYILYRMDDLGVLVDYQYQFLEGVAYDLPVIGDADMDVTRVKTDTHIPNVEDYDFPLEPGDQFLANNSVHSEGYNRVEISFVDEIIDFNQTENHTRSVQVSNTLVTANVPAGNFETFKLIQDEVINETEGFQIRYYSSNVQNYVKENVTRLGLQWIRVLEEYNLPVNPNSLSIEPAESFAGENVTIHGSFPEYPNEEVMVSIPMADIQDTANTDDAGNFTLELEVPYAEDNTPALGVLGSLGVVAQVEDSYQVATLTIFDTPDNIAVEPESKAVIPEDIVTYTATLYDESGNVIKDVTDQVNWSIDEAAGGTWDQTMGTYTSENPGDWTVTCEFSYGSGELIDEAYLKVAIPDYIIVEPDGASMVAGDDLEFTATAYDEDDYEIRDVTEDTEWSIQEGAGGSWIDNVYTSQMPGTWNVTGSYTYNETEMSHEVELIVAEPGYIEIEPTGETITAGDSISYISNAYDGLGNHIGDVTEETHWEIETDADGLWDNNVYTAEKAGTWTVFGTYNYEGLELTDNVELTVEHAEEDHILITPESSYIEAGETQAYNTTVYDEFGNEIGEVTEDTNWSIEEEAGGSWVGNVYTSEIAGTWNVTGDYNGLIDNATLHVVPSGADYIVISPENTTVTAGGAQAYTATAYDEGGNEIGDVTAITSWSIEGGAGGDWEANEYTSEFAGEWVVTGNYGGLQNTSILIVEAGSPDPPTRLMETWACAHPHDLGTGQSLQFIPYTSDSSFEKSPV
ncbi:MAG: hypothetical protein R6U17_07965 [Thermoplasmata archaeon]